MHTSTLAASTNNKNQQAPYKLQGYQDQVSTIYSSDTVK